MLNDLFIIPDYDEARAIVTFTAPAEGQEAEWSVLDGSDVVNQGHAPCQPGEDVRIEVPMPGFKPWNVDTPHLYTLRLRLDGAPPTGHLTDFGMRKIHVTRDALYVNNEKFYVRGVIRGREAHDHPNLENLPLEEYYAKYIRMARHYGFNFIRFHSVVPPDACFRVADRLGVFLHIEMRKYFGRYQEERMTMNEEGMLLDEDEWTEMVLQLRNHPSLMIYCMGNEIDHPGRNPFCKEMYDLTHQLDPTRLFLDTCSRGEFDREAVDLDVQHMGYFFPLGHSYDMFDDTQSWVRFGSATGLPMIEQDAEEDYTGKITRSVPSPRPVLAHEVCHYAALRDLDALDRKFERTDAEKPWWIDELKKLVRQKHHEGHYPLLLEASRRFQVLSWRLTLEAVRRSRVLSGFHFLQFADTDRYENSNGLLDCFAEPLGVDAQKFLRFNGDAVILADLPRRTFFEREEIEIPVILSHFSPSIAGPADFTFTLAGSRGAFPAIQGGMKRFDLDERGRREVCRLRLRLPASGKPAAATLSLRLSARDDSWTIENAWDLWIYPNRPHELPGMKATVDLGEVYPAIRYPQIEHAGSMETPEQLMIVHRFSQAVLEHLAKGGAVLMLYRVPATRDRKTRADRETYYLPATWDRFKGVIWDRGHNCGAIVRSHPALEGFPHDGFLNLQFRSLVDDADKIVLDDFPVAVEPIMEGVDKATRDRFDVYTYKLSELQPDRTMRRFGYLFEVRVGPGRLLVSGFNFTGLNTGVPETCALFEALVRYVTSDAFQPRTEISPDVLEAYLLEKGKGPIVKERRMTQYWQLDEEPLESKRYWQESIEYLDDEPIVEDAWISEHQEDKLKRQGSGHLQE